MPYCCKECFSNKVIKEFIQENSSTMGECKYCGSSKTPLMLIAIVTKYYHFNGLLQRF